MIIIQLHGGLGNQLFQYAVGRQISINNGIDFKLDTNLYTNKSLRKYQLFQLNIKAQQATFDETNHLLPYYYRRGLMSKVINRYFKNLLRDYYLSTGKIIKEKENYHFDPDILTINKSVFLCGYWQNEKYFDDIRALIKQEFQLKDGIASNYFQKIQKDILWTNSISIHIRRGDILGHSEKYIYLDDYFKKAMNYILNRMEDAVFYVFSDDLIWARENIKSTRPVVYVDSCGNDCEDLLLMSACKHHIIANSTFSWWGAWLGSEDSIVVSPSTWFTDGRKTYDFIPERWLRL